MFQAMLDKAEKTAEEKKQDDGCPDCFCEDCDKNCLAKEFGIIGENKK